MSNLTAFNRVVVRAKAAEDKRTGFNDSIRVEVPTTVILFANEHILALEEQLSKLQREVHEYRAAAKVSYPSTKPEPRDSAFGIE